MESYCRPIVRPVCFDTVPGRIEDPRPNRQQPPASSQVSHGITHSTSLHVHVFPDEAAVQANSKVSGCECRSTAGSLGEPRIVLEHGLIEWRLPANQRVQARGENLLA